MSFGNINLLEEAILKIKLLFYLKHLELDINFFICLFFIFW